MLDSFMQQLGKELELENSLSTEVPGVYAIPLDEDLNVLITEIPRGFELTCTVCESPTEQQEEFYTQALFANLFSQGTEGCVLGLDATGEDVTLSRLVDYDINYQEFRDIIEDFLNSVEFWVQETGAYTNTMK